MRQKPYTIFTHQEGLEFLSNMRPYPIVAFGKCFRASENLYQFSKLPQKLRNEYVDRFTKMHPFVARKITRKLPVREDWEEIKLKVMFDVLRLKFYQHPYLLKQLLQIEGPLAEFNTWRDTYWGYDLNLQQGKNHLGKLYMLLRDAWKKGRYPRFSDYVYYQDLSVEEMFGD